MIVAHSMGGLIARVAQGLLDAEGSRKLARLILVGTPNYGSFAPVMALRGVYPAVRKVATLDPKHTAETLSRRVFNTFPGLHHMLPAVERFAQWDLYDPAAWPGGNLGPRRSLLRSVARMRSLLAPADKRVATVIGIDQDTITNMARNNGELLYFVSRNGDGTVPVEMARLPGAPAYYVRENHASMPANSLVCSAVVDLLRTGTTRQLSRRWTNKPGERPISESALRQSDVQKFDWEALSAQERRLLLQGLVLPMPTGPARTGAAKR
jgi:pimeloyl-ACP methyl ester carboxylesterase